ncbi:PQQ-binding-like beta-propeller repeat protein [Pelagicoccus enzymogenes]|uniref:outer membrane protein assembly factor BamB family protein n=1 Tax=Pelagicoccus enzymogenes TaxID=2773457 RepID=UPI00281063E3|nr:PQQ-binding-like beta-propeller repeat protein [Pelagicoccus enzymogenes]MDQ8199362.1 PQQ-binding-like beta-propeller repeat protein [Pelagicoccus enzymogenes]
MPRFIPLSLLACLGSALCLATSSRDWSAYLGDRSSSQFSELSEITTDNVTRLEPAWIWDGDKGAQGDRGYSEIQCNPLVIDGVLYGTDANIDLIALDAVTGDLLWKLDPYEGLSVSEGRGVNRGLVYWESGDESRILFGVSRFLIAVDPKTGKRIESFGEAGRVDLKADLGRDAEGLQVMANTPGVVYGDLIVMPMRLGEGPAPAAPGPIRAYNVRTGELVWRFNTIPQPGEFGYETWPPEAYKSVGGANVWAGMSVDVERGILYCPTGSAAFDFWGGDRLGQNLFANCLIALDAATGKRIWHYQFVRHDIWDRDLPAPPNLLTVHRDGEAIPAVAQITKSGHVFLFNRVTGEPLFPIEEVPVPWSDLRGEQAWPTQPLPVKPAPFARQQFSADQITDISPESQREVMDRFVTLRPHMPFMPPSKEGTIIFPGFDGGGEWGGAAVDPNGILYVNSNEMPWVLTMVDATAAESEGQRIFMQNCAGCHGAEREGSLAQNVPALTGIQDRMTREGILERITQGKGVMPPFGFFEKRDLNAMVDFLVSRDGGDRHADKQAKSEGSVSRPWTHTGYRRWLDSKGYPAVKPPWGTLNAIDMNTGEFVWKTTLGEFEELTSQGIQPTGTENYGGPVVTAGGLLFIGASKDGFFRAFDAATGEELWKYKLPAGAYATPAVYEADGRQFVAVACGGGKMGTPRGNYYVAFALGD